MSKEYKLLIDSEVENKYSINVNGFTNNNIIGENTNSEEDNLDACCGWFYLDKKIEIAFEKAGIINFGSASFGAFCAAVIATKGGVPRLPYPNKWGALIAGLSSGLSNLSMLYHFNISKTIKEAREARVLLRKQAGCKYLFGWSLWYFLWASCFTGGLGQGELTAGTLPFWLPDNPSLKMVIFVMAYLGFVLSRMSSIPRLIKRLYSENWPDDLYTNPKNFTLDEKIFYYLSQLQSIAFVIISYFVVEKMYEFKWLLGFDRFFGTHFCPPVQAPALDNCSNTPLKYRLLGFFPSIISANSFYFAQERGLFHCYRACKLYYSYHKLKFKSNWECFKLMVELLMIIFLPVFISYFSIQGLLSPSARVELLYEMALAYFLPVNATSMWKEFESKISKLVASVDSKSQSTENSQFLEAEETNGLRFFNPPSSRVSITGATQNGYQSTQAQQESDYNAQTGYGWRIWEKIKTSFSCCRSRRHVDMTIEGGSYTRF